MDRGSVQMREEILEVRFNVMETPKVVHPMLTLEHLHL